nr:alpha-amylase [Planctomycetota bacterium]
MTAITFYFQVHQPYRLKRLEPGHKLAKPEELFDDAENERLCRRVAARGYLRTNRILLRAIDESEGAFRCAFSISGTALSQLEAWALEALDSFVALAETGAVEFLAETSHHSLACFGNLAEFEAQVAVQRKRIEALFGRRPTTFRNTELILSENIAKIAERLGFSVILGEGIEHLLHGRNVHEVWRPRGCRSIVTLLRDYRFSDDIAFRFSNREWDQYPLDARRFAQWMRDVPASEPFVGLFM